MGRGRQRSGALPSVTQGTIHQWYFPTIAAPSLICSFFFFGFPFAGLLLKCTTNINRPHRAASCGSVCRLLTEAGGWWSGFSAVRCHCGIKGDEGDGKLLISRWCFVGFHLFMAFMVGVSNQLCLIFSSCHMCCSAVAAVVFDCQNLVTLSVSSTFI